MSIDYKMDYFPPNGTKYPWHPPPLQYKPIGCRVECLTWPQSLILTCDREAKGYRGYVTFYSISGGPRKLKRTRLFNTALGACRATERIGDKLLAEDTQPWMKEAVQHKWRTPPLCLTSPPP